MPRLEAAYPFSHGSFVKEPLGFLRINPQSSLVKKYLQIGPFSSLLTPELPGF
jgi:hypothetical protein